MRIAGAQIPVTLDIEANVTTIKSSIDWAVKNKCHFLVTPECSLSGYDSHFDEDTLCNALSNIEEYAKSGNIGLCLGTLWKEDEEAGQIRRNQIRFYDNLGQLIGVTNKTYLVNQDAGCLRHDLDAFGVTVHNLRCEDIQDVGRQQLNVVGLICNDLWGNGWPGKPSIPNLALQTELCNLFIHATNGARGNPHDEIYNKWHDAHLLMISQATQIPIITVDNTCHMNGHPYDGPTSSESGVTVDGKWVTNVPRTGTQHFYYDF
jgi:predicted amidohydrolase